MTGQTKVTRPTALPFVMVATQIIRDESLSGQARHLYTVLASYADVSSREARLYRSTLAQVIGKSVDTLDRLVKELASAGIVSVLQQTKLVDGKPVFLASVYSLHDAALIGARMAAEADQNAEIDLAAPVRLPRPEDAETGDLGGRTDAATLAAPMRPPSRTHAAGVAAPVRHITRTNELEPVNEKEEPPAAGAAGILDRNSERDQDSLFAVEATKSPPTGRRKRTTYEDHPRFPEFWAVYPRTEDGRKPASIKFSQVVRDGADVDVIIAGAARHRDDPRRQDRFTKQAAAWLNQACWNDKPRTFANEDANGRPRVADGNNDHWKNGGGFGLPA